jgi:epidermal growth factor receptor substrate 15
VTSTSKPTYLSVTWTGYGVQFCSCTRFVLTQKQKRNLIDIEQRGSLNSIEFAIGMHLIQGVKTCQITTLPTSIPAHIYDQFSVKSQSPSVTLRSPPKSAPLPWKSPSLSVKTAVSSHARENSEEWDVSVVEQAEARGHFDTLDIAKKGIIDGDESARYMLKLFRLTPNDIAEIWSESPYYHNFMTLTLY